MEMAVLASLVGPAIRSMQIRDRRQLQQLYSLGTALGPHSHIRKIHSVPERIAVTARYPAKSRHSPRPDIRVARSETQKQSEIWAAPKMMNVPSIVLPSNSLARLARLRE